MNVHDLINQAQESLLNAMRTEEVTVTFTSQVPGTALKAEVVVQLHPDHSWSFKGAVVDQSSGSTGMQAIMTGHARGTVTKPDGTVLPPPE